MLICIWNLFETSQPRKSSTRRIRHSSASTLPLLCDTHIFLMNLSLQVFFSFLYFQPFKKCISDFSIPTHFQQEMLFLVIILFLHWHFSAPSNLQLLKPFSYQKIQQFQAMGAMTFQLCTSYAWININQYSSYFLHGFPMEFSFKSFQTSLNFFNFQILLLPQSFS